METKFKVAMDKEQAALKNHYEVILQVDMSKASRADLEKYALRAYTVELQGQIRPNWTAFVSQCEGKTFKKSITFGDALFASTKGKVTQKKARAVYKDSMATMTVLQKLRKLLDDDMISVDMYEASVEKLFDKGEITQEEFDEAMDI